MLCRPAAIALLLSTSVLTSASGAVIGRNQPAPALSVERLGALPLAEQASWKRYLERSDAQARIDRSALAAERRPDDAPIAPPAGRQGSMRLDKADSWYASAEARHIADVIVSFQTPAGGWSKNQDRTGPLRQRGQHWALDNRGAVRPEAGPDNFDAPRDPSWEYVGTLDNNATITEMRFLAKVAAQTLGKAGEPYRKSFLKGVRYLLDAQFPNGGWPQVWPLQGGYHDAITFNDSAVSNASELLTQVSRGDFAFVPAKLRVQADTAARKGRKIIVATQIRVDGKLTAWGQQADPFTLEPVSGRNYEPPALASGESADILLYLMSLPDPLPAEVAAVHAGAAWLRSTAIRDKAWTGGRSDPAGRRLVDQAGAGPIWARYYTKAGQPIFGDRDKSLHDDVNGLSLERRNGYAWFGVQPVEALKAYENWAKSHPPLS